MISHTVTTSTLRLWASPQAQWGDPYDAVCTLLWEGAGCVQVVAFHGAVNRRMLAECLQWLLQAGVQTVRASRHHGKRLPGAVLREDGYLYLDVVALAQRRGGGHNAGLHRTATARAPQQEE